MVEIYGQQSVELTREVFMDMKRTDLVQRLSKPSSGLKEKHSVGKHPPASSEREVSVTLLQQKLLETLEDFSPGDLEKFKHVLLYTKMKEGLPRIPTHRLETADRVQTVKLMVELYGQQSEEVIREVFNKMNRRDLVQRLSDISSGSEGPSRNQELEGCGSIIVRLPVYFSLLM
ncbi:pyrin-like [Pagrus major]|uniref:pyrin-like n=1 Tax=Pagrus major TaxID=143350 RepID=UPI003CC85F1C